jgi:hypothetical protein
MVRPRKHPPTDEDTMSDDTNLGAQLADYDAPTPRVEALSGATLTAFVGDDVPALGEGLWVGEGPRTLTRVVRHAGNRRVEAVALSRTPALAVGAPVARAHAQAHLPAAGAALDLAAASFAPAGDGALGWSPARPGFAALDARRPPLPVGRDELDLLSPLAARGANLVVDRGDDPAAFTSLVEAAHAALAPDAVLYVATPDLAALGALATHTIHPGDTPEAVAWALRAAALLGGRLRDEVASTLVVVSLPAWSIDEAAFRVGGATTGLEVTFSELVDWLGEALVSTRAGTVTTLMRLPIDATAAGLADLSDTLAVGDVDAQVFFEEGAYDPRRSRSRAEQSDADRAEAMRVRGALARAAAASSHAAIFGDDGLGEDPDLELLGLLDDDL